MTNKAVLITGASSGIGFHLATYLAEREYTVFPTVRKQIDFEKLEKIENIFPLILDVTEPSQIEAAAAQLKRDSVNLVGLVNNAGIGGLGFLSSFNDEDIYQIFNVNTFGPIRMTNSFLQLLLENHGRIINIGSQGGMITGKLAGPYTMTKFALEAYSDCLREELAPYNIKVSLVEPGGIKSVIGENAVASQITRLKRVSPPFKEEADMMLNYFDNPPPETKEGEPESTTNRKVSDPLIVSEAVFDALTSENPKPRYLVGTRWEGNRVINTLISKLIQVNDNPNHNYSRDELIAILDKHIEAKAEGNYLTKW